MSIFHFTRRALRHWPSSLSTSIEIKSVLMSNYPSALTFFNFKNGCPTSAGTGTLYRQIPMFHPLNPRKTVPPLGHFLPENTQLFPSTNQNILNFMSQFLMNSILPHSSHSVEINPSVLMFLCLMNDSGLTFVNNKNGWNASKCYSSTLTIKHFVSINYPPKKWNTPVTLFPHKSPIFPKTTPIFNILLTNPIASARQKTIRFYNDFYSQIFMDFFRASETPFKH